MNAGREYFINISFPAFLFSSGNDAYREKLPAAKNHNKRRTSGLLSMPTGYPSHIKMNTKVR